jgi:hypothetical protein
VSPLIRSIPTSGYKETQRNLDLEPEYDRRDRGSALHAAADHEKQAVGILYQDKDLRSPFEESLKGYSKTGLVHDDLRLSTDYLAKLQAEHY